ncbi:RNA-splicing ligase RtcB [Candidatus Gottesmanbacteria bacterium RBG_16_38_7b]|uniref:tRNA-splicing ligase RtcB n=1 Tax=Candidatus Gottesmanbacteria bacterium RBG_16_38_7b TaxID=1798372 RepID=A0A1F5YJY5_9BACT|nr:MAG: RNA-splicing ligase RtcB [Candidatus Gottesmanbacteria bacterium RBG_16_38_7b]
MISKKDLKRIDNLIWEIPKSYRSDMNVPARLFASVDLLMEILPDKSLEQLINITTLPGIQLFAAAMPDIHQGYGFPIGGIAAFDLQKGIISPGGIGYDINCGVRLLTSQILFRDFQEKTKIVADLLFQKIPSGVGVSGVIKLDKKSLQGVLTKGAAWVVEKGYGEGADLQFLESEGHLSDADPACVSQHAKERGSKQLGSMGAGNHFVEIDCVDEIYDKNVAATFGLFKNQITVLIHCGSRGLGHQVATDYIRIMLNNLSKYQINLVDRELSCAPFSSKEGNNYFRAMTASANFAWANRQIITASLREIWQKVFAKSESLKILYDISHNIAKIENHQVNGHVNKLLVHRKGATRAFGPHHQELPASYKKTGQPVIIPGSMGSYSFVLVGQEQASYLSFGSSCHGAGRRMSRKKALKEFNGVNLIRDLKMKNITVMAGSVREVAEEAPLAYKDIDQVINVVDQVGIAKKVARLKPLIVVKG